MVKKKKQKGQKVFHKKKIQIQFKLKIKTIYKKMKLM